LPSLFPAESIVAGTSKNCAPAEPGARGVRLYTTVSIVPEPTAMLAAQFKVIAPFDRVIACPGLQFPLTPVKENLFAVGL